MRPVRSLNFRSNSSSSEARATPQRTIANTSPSLNFIGIPYFPDRRFAPLPQPNRRDAPNSAASLRPVVRPHLWFSPLRPQDQWTLRAFSLVASPHGSAENISRQRFGVRREAKRPPSAVALRRT